MIKVIFFGLVLLLALSFFGISLQSIVDSPTGQANFAYVGHIFSVIWDYLHALISRLAA